MDLSEIKPVERIVEILHPKSDAPLGLRVSLRSINDPAMKAAKRRIQDEKTRLDKAGKILKAERIEENQNDLIYGAMTGWEWYNPTGKQGDEGFDPNADLTFKGKKPEFNKPSVLMVLNELEWVVDQLADAISEEKAFF